MTKISFDFDGNLNDHFDGQNNPNKEDMQELLSKLCSDDNFDVYIITRRFGPEHSEKGNKNEHEKVFLLLNQLNLHLNQEKVLFTNREYKYSMINSLKIDIHLDDDIKDCELIDKLTTGRAVNTSEINWRQKFEALLLNE